MAIDPRVQAGLDRIEKKPDRQYKGYTLDTKGKNKGTLYSSKGLYKYDIKNKTWVLTTKGSRIRAKLTKDIKTDLKDGKSIVRTRVAPTVITTPLTTKDETDAQLVNAYLALSTSELFLYLNNQSIQGNEFNYGMNGVLNNVRRSYRSPNQISGLLSFIKHMYVKDDVLYLEFDAIMDRQDIVVEFYTKKVDRIEASYDY